MENHTCELTKDGAGLSNSKQFSLQTKQGDVSHVSSNCRLIGDTDKISDCGQAAEEPPCDADCQSMLYETSGNIPMDNGNLQSELVKSCTLASEFNHSEQQKEWLSPPERATDEQYFGHGHDGFHDKENNAVGEGSKMPCDVVPGPLMNNSTIRPSDLKQSDGGIFTSPEQKFLVDEGQVHSEIVKPCIMVSEVSHSEQLEPLPDDKSKSTGSLHELVLALQSATARGCAGKKSGAKVIASHEKSGAELKPSIISVSPNCRSSDRKQKKTPVTKVKSEYRLRKQRNTPETKVINEYKPRKQKETSATKVESQYTPKTRGRRSSIQEKAVSSEPDSNLENASTGRKRGKKKRRKNSEFHDEFKRMRVHLRYLLHRIRYEQNLIDAYSNEGWRGQSLEKLRPEKELQRAKLDINRSKLKIRGLFQRLDAICAEGQFPKTLFDSEGLIDSEDIFCAKCGCRDLSPNNDIILCDGACDRGFHQLCLDPPLRTDEIPPGDEGWFCPACDCKFDCVELLNDSMETKLSLNHNWENIFPEVAAKTGGTQDDLSGLPSDDSDDNDFNPSVADDDNMEGGESTSDESDFSSASEDLEAIIHNNNDQYDGLPSDDPKAAAKTGGTQDDLSGLPSDDSDDNDFNPSGAEDDNMEGGESTSDESDFSSASEDLEAIIHNNDDQYDGLPSDDPKAAAKTGGTQDDLSGLPSDDSDDNDFNPSGADDDNMEGGESTSDESDFSSASEDLEAIIHNNDDQYDGLPSDDPEDDDYDPVFVDAEDQPKQESSSSDFTSASEDLNAAIENDEISSKDEGLVSPSKLLQDCDDVVPVSGRRQIEKLDYKKLYDETYGNSSSDSSDDDDWNDAKTPNRMKNGHENTSSHSSEGEEGKDRVTPKKKNGPGNVSSPITTYVISDAAGGLSSVVRNTSATGQSPMSPKVGISNDSQTPETSSGLKKNNRPPYKRLGEAVVQRLYAYFKENQYPDNSTKEKLAGELGLLPKQVNKWFVNTRWSVNHPTGASASGVTSTGKPRSHRNATKSIDEKGNPPLGDVASNEVGKASLEASKDVPQNSPANPRRKRKSDAGETSSKRTLRSSKK